MTDRELLELAAKAAGLTIQCDADKAVVFPSHHSGGFAVLNDRGGSALWNPLTADGDALRLAVRLNITVHPGFVYTPTGKLINHRGHANRMAATRRAIVRAAAEIGKTK